MNTIFMNSKNSKTSDSHRLLFNLTNKVNYKRSYSYVTLANISMYYTWKDMKMSYKNNKFKISAPKQNQEFELPDGSYSTPDIQDSFEYILKSMESNWRVNKNMLYIKLKILPPTLNS